MLLLITSCSKKIDVGGTPDISVVTESMTYKAGEEVKFIFDGHADMISFYSGEPFNDYSFKDGRIVDIGSEAVNLSFRSSVQNGTQNNQLSVWVSTDYNGAGDIQSVGSATWTEITNRFTLGTNATFVASTSQNISDLTVPGKPLYVAFKYLTRPQAVNGLSRTWYIESFSMVSGMELGGSPINLTSMLEAGFRVVERDSVNTPARTGVTTSRITLLGNIYKDPADPIYDPENPIYDRENPIYDPESELFVPGAVPPTFVPYDPSSPFNDPLMEHWVISKPINLNQVDLGPDRSIPLKGISSSKLEEYRYTYNEPGTYKAHFVASNTNIDDNKEVVKVITLTITE